MTATKTASEEEEELVDALYQLREEKDLIEKLKESLKEKTYETENLQEEQVALNQKK